MAANTIASGAAILTANADGLASGLGKAGADLKRWGTAANADMKHALKFDAGKDLISASSFLKVGPITSATGAVVQHSGAMKDLAKGIKAGELAELGLLGAVTALTAALGRGFDTAAMERFNSTLERGVKLATELQGIKDARLEKVFQFGVKLDAGPLQKDYFRAEAAKLEKEIAGVKARLRSDQNALDALRGDTGRQLFEQLPLVGSLPFQKSRFEVDEKELAAKVDEANKSLGSLSRRWESFKSIVEGPVEIGAKLSGLGSIFNGMDSVAGGFEVARAREKDFATAIASMTDKLKFQAETFGMTAAQAELYALKSKFAGDFAEEAFSEVSKWADEVDRLNAGLAAQNNLLFAPALIRGSKEAYSAEMKALYGNFAKPNLGNALADAGKFAKPTPADFWKAQQTEYDKFKLQMNWKLEPSVIEPLEMKSIQRFERPQNAMPMHNVEKKLDRVGGLLDRIDSKLGGIETIAKESADEAF